MKGTPVRALDCARMDESNMPPNLPPGREPARDHGDPASFWTGMSPCEHFVQIYRDEASLLALLQRFVTDGLQAGEATIVIATPGHLVALERHLLEQDIDLVAARWQGQYLPMDARATLRQFMLPTGPDAEQFSRVMVEVLRRARRQGRGVRAFGEMVSLLWADGAFEATLQLERLWNTLCADQSLPLFCAYPQSAFDADSSDALSEICRAHTRLIAA